MRPAAGLLVLPHRDPEGVRALLGIAADSDLDALLTAAPRLSGLFRLPAPTAPSAVMIGAGVPFPGGAASATGVAETARAALGACLGEAAEIFAQTPPAPHAPERSEPGDPEAARVAARGAAQSAASASSGFPRPTGEGASPGEARLPGVALPDGRRVFVPARLCLRLGDARPSSLGLAAGRDRAAARRAALFELIERDAFARWRALGAALAPPGGVVDVVVALFERLGRPAGAPAVSLAVLPSVVGAPVVLVRSDLGWGCAAAETVETAARRAALELVGAETGAAIEAARGRAPRPPPRVVPADRAARRPPVDLDATIRRLAARDAPVVEIDLSRPDVAAPVVRLFCAALGADAPRWRAP